MNSSAKITFTFLAAAALGTSLAVLAACSVNSGTVDDTDGGLNNDTGTTAPTPDTGTTPEDTGTPPATCTSNQQGVFVSQGCQDCLAANCCTELQACYNIPGDTDGGTVDCNTYDTCIDNCATNSDPETCNANCDSAAAPGVPAAYDGIVNCAKGNPTCAAACGAIPEDPDAGH